MIATAFIFKFMLTETARGSHRKSLRMKNVLMSFMSKFKVLNFELLCKMWEKFLEAKVNVFYV